MKRILLASLLLLSCTTPVLAQYTPPTVNKLIAGSGIALSPVNGRGNVTVSISGGGGAVTNVSGDGVLITNSSSTGAVTLTLGTALPAQIVGSSLTSVGTIGTGTWNGTRLTSSYIPTDTAYLDAGNSWTVTQVPATAGAIDIGSAAKPWRTFYGTDNTDTTNYYQIVPQALSGNRTVNVPDANSTTVQASSASAHQFATSVSATTGAITWTQPAFTDISGTASAAQLPVATASLQGAIPALTDAQMIVGKTASNVQAVTLSGDVTITNAGVTALKTLGTGAGSCTNCNITFDANGRETTYATGTGTGTGTVTSVAMTGDGVIFGSTVSGSPITTTGTLVPALKTQSANTALRGPSSGSAATPAFRQDALADLPTAYTHPMQCRLYLSSGAPTADVSNATGNFYVGPYGGGNCVSLPDTTGNNYTTFNFSEIATAIPSQIFRIEDVFLYNNSGTVTVEIDPWDASQTTGTVTGATAANPCVLTATNSLSAGQFVGIAGIVGTMGTTAANGLNGKVFKVASATGTTITLESGINTTGLTYTSGGSFYVVPTTRSTGLTLTGGQYQRTGALNKVYIGTFMAGAEGVSGQAEDNSSSRLVWNYYNRILKLGIASDTTSSWTYTTATFRPRDNSTASGVGRIELLTGIDEDAFVVSTTVSASSTLSNITAASGVDLDSVTTTITPQANLVSQVSNIIVFASLNTPIPTTSIPAGYHFLQATEFSLASGTTTWYGNTVGALTTLLGRF